MSLSTFISNSISRWSGTKGSALPTSQDGFPDMAQAPLDSRRQIRDRRYCYLLSKHRSEFDELSIACAWKGLQHEMAYVPSGSALLVQDSAMEHGSGYGLTMQQFISLPVEPFYIDRNCVSNADFSKFVQAGGYDNPALWPQEILPQVLQFQDQTGCVGPKFWSDGRPPEEKLRHPVVGICWYEACAYARWAGKRLPTSAEWQRAGTWHDSHSAEGLEQRYPWGNSFQANKANLWRNGDCGTIPVDALDESATPNGVRQLVGNVWEWIDGQFLPMLEGDVQILLDDTMAEVRGGAFDTYFSSQATCQFRSGQPMMHRPYNVGFRCCVSVDELQPETNLSEAGSVGD